MELSIVSQILKNLFFITTFIGVNCLYLLLGKKSRSRLNINDHWNFLNFHYKYFYMIILPLFWSYSIDSMRSRELIITLVGFVGFIGNVMFGVGLLLLIVQQVKKVVKE
ncbi:MAG: hypothetical protein IPG89_04670 [Bacteroidetes bacterium]|nr:hypothetical protein [Bacteroidota bacterium]